MLALRPQGSDERRTLFGGGEVPVRTSYALAARVRPPPGTGRSRLGDLWRARPSLPLATGSQPVPVSGPARSTGATWRRDDHAACRHQPAGGPTWLSLSN